MLPGPRGGIDHTPVSRHVSTSQPVLYISRLEVLSAGRQQLFQELVPIQSATYTITDSSYDCEQTQQEKRLKRLGERISDSCAERVDLICLFLK